MKMTAAHADNRVNITELSLKEAEYGQSYAK